MPPIPPIPPRPAGIPAASSSGESVIRASVVRNIPAILAAFCKAERDLNAACEQFDCSVDEAPEEHEAYQAAEAAIIEKPANGLAGVAVKLALWVHNDGEPIGIDETMDDAHCPEMVSAWRDAVRLAGLPEGLGTTSYREAYLGLEGGEPDASA